jgi:crotonobetainyl-CoA:carnitine CoA-transferase CaiB-like acyl-CoA transferase
MTAVLEGVKVLEVAEYAMAPAAGAVLADWGADVIKIERADRGDSVRGAVSNWGDSQNAGGLSHLWEPFNRGKRSVGVDLRTPEGREFVLKLAEGADVFLTNFLPAARRRLRLEVDDLRAVNPGIVYAQGSAHGPVGPEAERGGFDGSTYWLRSGLGWAATPDGYDGVVTLPGPAVGDIQTGLALAGGIAAALFHRERTGWAPVVDTSLLGCGVWAMQASLAAANIARLEDLPHADRRTARNPLWNVYCTSDRRYLALAMMQADAFWAPLCRVIGRDDLAGDARYATFEARAANHVACIADLDAVFAAQSLAHWETVLAQQDGPWARVQIVTELNDDAQVWANGYLQSVDYGEGRRLTLSPVPVHFDGAAATLRPAPPHALHTEEVALELGLSWERILQLKDAGAIT